MKQGKQAANPLSFPRLKKFRALLTREASPEVRIPISIPRDFPTAPAGAGPGPPRPHALRPLRHRETSRASHAKRARRPAPRDSRGGARAGGGRSTCHGLPGEAGGGAWAKPTAGVAPALPHERYPPPRHPPRSPVQPRPRSGKPLFSACAKSATPEAGLGGGGARVPAAPRRWDMAPSSAASTPPARSPRYATRERSPPSFLLLPPQRPPLPTSPPSPAVPF